MSTVSRSQSANLNAPSIVRDYISLTKPVAVLMIALVCAAGYTLALRGGFDLSGTASSSSVLLLMTLFISVSSAGSFALNQYYERELDKNMPRVCERALPAGRINATSAAIFGYSCFLVPLPLLAYFVNVECALLTFLCGALYLWAYTPLKRLSSMSTFIGAIPGALLPLMGWSAARSDWHIDILFPTALLFIWQVPHALVIALKYTEDYRAGGMKQLPIVAGSNKSLQHMVFSTFMTGFLSFLPLVRIENSVIYFLGTFIVSTVTLYFAFKAYRKADFNSLRIFFIVHLISLPVQLLFFVYCL